MKCLIMKDLIAIENPEEAKPKFQMIDFIPSKGFIFNSMKMRTGFLNRLKLSKEELKVIESQSKGRKPRQGMTDDPYYTSIFVIMSTLHTHYRENDFLIKQMLTSIVENEEYLNTIIARNQIQYFKQVITYDHFKSLLERCGEFDRLDEVRLGISHEFLNQLNFVMFQLWAEISVKQAKHSLIFNQMLDSEGYVKRSDFIQVIHKLSIMSEYQLQILLKFYDSLNTDKIHGQAFLDHMAAKDFIGVANTLNIRNDLIPYHMHKMLLLTEQVRFSKIQATYEEALSHLNSTMPKKEDGTIVLHSTTQVNPLLTATQEQIDKFIDNWIPGLNHQVKLELTKQLCFGEKGMQATSIWNSNGYNAMLKHILDTVSVHEYNQNILFKEVACGYVRWLRSPNSLRIGTSSQGSGIRSTQKELNYQRQEVIFQYFASLLHIKPNTQVGISQIEADLIFKKLTKGASVGRMDYDQYLMALIIMSQRMYPGIETKQSMDLLFANKLQIIEEQISQSDRGDSNLQITQLMEVLKDEYMVEILSCVHKTLIPYYHFYSHQKTGLLNFDGFSKFCLDFGIFPDILSKSKIMRFFSTLSGFYQQNAIENGGLAEKNVIDEHLFVEALALTAFEVRYREPQPTNAEKIVMLIERMNTSEGPAKVQMSYGRTRFGHGETTNDLVFLFRASYPELFEKREHNIATSRSERNLAHQQSLNGLFEQLLLGK